LPSLRLGVISAIADSLLNALARPRPELGAVVERELRHEWCTWLSTVRVESWRREAIGLFETPSVPVRPLQVSRRLVGR
jgi:hypothetical protein